MGKVTVNIHGRDYLISGNKTESEIKRIANRVDEEMERIAEASPMTSRADVAVLAALHIVESIVDSENSIKEAENNKLEAEAKAAESKIKDYEEKIKVLQNKVNEYENNFFDLQMENIKLKDEIERLK